MEKGFTLVELLATLVVIGVISFMSLTSLNKQVKKTSEASYEEFLATINLAVDSYIVNNGSSELKIQNRPVCINLKNVVIKKFLSSKITNPKTNVLITNSSVVVTLDSNNKFTYAYHDNELCA